MNGLYILIISVIVLGLAYILYGRFLSRIWKIDEKIKTPAHEYEDGEEYVPTNPVVVFGYEFASIAGAGPINGPILAAGFGWLPALLWLLLGSTFFGAVHDFAALYTSVKNQGKSIGYIIELYVGKTGKRLFLIFIWLFSILVIAAFSDIVINTFTILDNNPTDFTNGSVASSSLLFIVSAVGLGFLIKKKKISDLASAIIAIDILIACIILGIFFPIILPKSLWLYLVFGYIFTASILPVWILGQPRNYLNSFLLIAMIIAAFIGVVFINPKITLPAFTAFSTNRGYLFPALFITIACGAISGLHSLIVTGTVSKQISNEKYILPVSYGSMLMETMVAILALIAVGSMAQGGILPQESPPEIFAKAVSGFLSQLGLPYEVSFVIVSLAISSFVLTTLDTVARLGRLSFQELFSNKDNDKKNKKTHAVIKVLKSKPSAAVFTLGPAFYLTVVGYDKIWALFGSANQLLAALTLIACTMFFRKTGRRLIMLLIPTVFMLCVTFTSLFFEIRDRVLLLWQNEPGLDVTITGLQTGIALLLFILGIIVSVSCAIKLMEKNPNKIIKAKTTG